jgi:serine/threonine protein kinase
VSAPTGYRIIEKLHEGSLTLIYRARRREDDRPVILKMLRSEYPSQEELARLRSEYQNTKGLNDDNIIKVFGYEEQGKTAILVLEDFGGTSLDHILSVKRPNLKECLHIALNVVKALEALHARQMVHKDINPSNIVWNRESNEVKLIDLAFASAVPAERAVQSSPDVAEGTLTYIGPEQTGRINRLPDYRSDLYSLGASLYELVTGQPPFLTDDALELVHAHIAKQPLPPHAMDADIPEALSAVIMKLLAKTAEERYQSTYGLRQDLLTCLQQLQTGHTQDPFTPGESDISSTFSVSHKLYGREQESAVLLDAFERVSRGGGELVMIGGYSGGGQNDPRARDSETHWGKRGYFATGKFDLLNRSIPYHAFIQAFAAFRSNHVFNIGKAHSIPILLK